MKAIVITGVAGLLWSRLDKWVVENRPDYQVIGIDNLSGPRKLMDTTKLTSFGWKPSIGLHEGIKRTIQEVKDKF